MDETNWSNDFYLDDLESFSCIINIPRLSGNRTLCRKIQW